MFSVGLFTTFVFFFVLSRRHWVMKPIGGAGRCWWTSSCSFPPLSCVVWMRWVHSKSMRRPLLLGVRFLDHIMPYHAISCHITQHEMWLYQDVSSEYLKNPGFFVMCLILTSHILELSHNSHIITYNSHIIPQPNMPQFQGDGDAGADDGRSGNSCWVQFWTCWDHPVGSRDKSPLLHGWNDVKSKDWSIYPLVN